METLTIALGITEIAKSRRFSIVTGLARIGSVERARSPLDAHIRGAGITIVAIRIGSTTIDSRNALPMDTHIDTTIGLRLAFSVCGATERPGVDATCLKRAAIKGTASIVYGAVHVLLAAAPHWGDLAGQAETQTHGRCTKL
jgi:hypothetical protein